MKTRSSGLVLACCIAVAASAAASDASNVTVIFDRPENFRDVKDAFVPTEKGRDDIFAEFRRFLADRAASYLDQGQRLEIKFTDIDLAGDFEPHVGTRFDAVRIMKDVYPPRLEFDFKLTGADGRVIKEGKRRLTDMSYLQRIIRPGNDGSLRYEEDLLTDWMHEDLAKAKSAG